MPLKTWYRSILPALFLLGLPALSMAQVSVNVSVGVAPPELPVYDQPPIPGDGYLWTPGYWAWSDDDQDYYWVPGTWVLAPQPDYLWTPGYWGVEGAVFFWHPGYWGPHVGFYGGVDYGYGYGGRGFEGGYWQGGRLYYNRSVNNINNTNITNVYNKTVINNITVNRVSYNGGSGGVRAQPSAADEAAAHDRHIGITPLQSQHQQAARSNPVLRASQNGGHPSIAATPRPGTFSGAGVVAARHAGTLSVVHADAPSRSAQPENRAAQQRAQRAPPQPDVEQRRQSEQNQQPRQYAPQPQRAPQQQREPQPQRAPQQQREPQQQHAPQQQREPQPRPEPRAEPHPAQHQPEHKEEHEHHPS